MGEEVAFDVASDVMAARLASLASSAVCLPVTGVDCAVKVRLPQGMLRRGMLETPVALLRAASILMLGRDYDEETASCADKEEECTSAREPGLPEAQNMEGRAIRHCDAQPNSMQRCDAQQEVSLPRVRVDAHQRSAARGGNLRSEPETHPQIRCQVRCGRGGDGEVGGPDGSATTGS